MEFKDRLRSARKSAKLSQAELAAMVGLDQTTISDLENGRTRSTGKTVELAVALGVSQVWLATGEGDETSSDGTAEGKPQDYLAGTTFKSPRLATRKAQLALDRINQAAHDRRLTEADLVLLEQIANRIAAQPAPADNIHNNTHERLKDRLDNDDSSTER